MDDVLGKALALIVIVSAVVFDWPRALGGVVAGYAGRKAGYPWIAIPVCVAAVAALGEVIYPLIGRTAGMSWDSFGLGVIAAGATAIGLFRILLNIADPTS